MIYVIWGGKRCGNPLQRFSKKERKVSEEMSRRFHPEIFNAFSLSSRDPTCLTFSRTFLFILLKLLSVDYFLRSCPLTSLMLETQNCASTRKNIFQQKSQLKFKINLSTHLGLSFVVLSKNWSRLNRTKNDSSSELEAFVALDEKSELNLIEKKEKNM